MSLDIEQLAQAAGMVTQFGKADKGIPPIAYTDREMGVTQEQLSRFAALVVQHEREACALCVDNYTAGPAAFPFHPTRAEIATAIRQRKD